MAEGRLQPFAVASPKDHVELLEEHARRTEGRQPHQKWDHQKNPGRKQNNFVEFILEEYGV